MQGFKLLFTTILQNFDLKCCIQSSVFHVWPRVREIQKIKKLSLQKQRGDFHYLSHSLHHGTNIIFDLPFRIFGWLHHQIRIQERSVDIYLDVFFVVIFLLLILYDFNKHIIKPYMWCFSFWWNVFFVQIKPHIFVSKAIHLQKCFLFDFSNCKIFYFFAFNLLV